MKLRIWGPAQNRLVDTFRTNVCETPRAPAQGRPHYIALVPEDGHEPCAVLRVDDHLDSTQRDRYGRHSVVLSLSELLVDRTRVSANAALMHMMDGLDSLIRDTYPSGTPICVQVTFTGNDTLRASMARHIATVMNTSNHAFTFSDVPRHGMALI